MKKNKIKVSSCLISDNGIVLPLNCFGRLVCRMAVRDGHLIYYKLGAFKLKK